MADRSIKEVIAELQEEIEERKTHIEMLKSFKELSERGLTEEEYHSLCLSSMRYTDELGKALLQVFPFLVYKKRQPNWFSYSINDTEVEVRIPNSACVGVEISVVCYRYDENSIQKTLHTKYLLQETQLSQLIKSAKAFEEAKSIIQKAKIVCNCRYRTWFAVLYYLYRNPKKKYKKFYAKKRIEAEAELAKLTAKKEQEYQDLVAERNEQQMLFASLAEKFLTWTNRVLIYDHNSSRSKANFVMKDGKLQMTETPW